MVTSNTFTPITLNNIVVSAVVSAGNVVLASNGVLVDVIINERAGHGMGTGIKFGTSNGGTDIVTALLVASSAFTFVPNASLQKRGFDPVNTQTIFYDAVTTWGGAALNMTIYYYQQ